MALRARQAWLPPSVGSCIILAIDPRFFVPIMSLVGVLLLGAVVIALVRRRYRMEATRPEAGNELARYRALYEQGAIDEQEYRSLRAVLGGELKQSVEGPTSKPKTDLTTTTPKTPDTSTGRDVPNTPTDGILPAE